MLNDCILGGFLLQVVLFCFVCGCHWGFVLFWKWVYMFEGYGLEGGIGFKDGGVARWGF